MEAPVCSVSCDHATSDLDSSAGRILRPEADEVVHSLEQGIADVHNEVHREETEEPGPPRDEVLLVARIALKVAGKQKCAQQIDDEAKTRTNR